MSFELAAALRRLKPQKRMAALVRRPDAELDFLEPPVAAGEELLLDTTVYIDVLQGRTPPELRTLLAVRTCNHSAVAVAELTHAFGRLDPMHPETAAALKGIERVIGRMPAHRLQAPTISAIGEAGIVAGTIARLRGLPKADRQPLLNDTEIFMQALAQGQTVLTRNVADFDMVQQLVPQGRVLMYRYG